jgi:arginase
MDTVRIIGAPTDYGSDRRGVDMGPSTIRYAGLAETIESLGVECLDAGDLLVPRAERRDPDASSVEGDAKHLRETEEVCRRLADEVAAAVGGESVPVVLGGDHSVGIGTLAGAGRDATIGTVWFDAHGDFNTPATTPSGNVHGMPLAAALGMGTFEDMDWARSPGLHESNVVHVGLRSVDDRERDLIRESSGTAFTMSDIDERGVAEVTREAIEIAADGVDALHVSLDLDWLDPNVAPGVGTPVRGGATYREAHTAMEIVAEYDDRFDLLRSFEVVEVNPVLDSHNETADVAAELAGSALGRRVL